MIKRFFILNLALGIAALCFGGENDKDSLGLHSPKTDSILNIEASQLADNLDSLLQLWFVEADDSTNEMSTQEFVDIEDSLTIPDFADSVYKRRLEEIPAVFDLVYNIKVRNYISVYAQKRRKQVEIMLGLKEYYFPMFEEILDMYDVPLEMKHLAVIESALNPRARSRVGATGLWQFMYQTGRKYGLQVDTYVDLRRDPLAATHAAGQFLSDLYAIYKDWTLVIAAYNCGPGNVNRAIRRSGGKTNFWEIYPYLPRETRGYVPAFIAATYIMTYHKEHNLFAKSIQLPLATDTVMIHQKLHLKQVAEVLKVPLEQLRDMNPQYKLDVIPAYTQKYALKLPYGHALCFAELEDSIYGYKDSVFFDKTNKQLAAKYSSPYQQKYEPTVKGKTKVYYTIKQGDNLGFISDWFNTSLSDIKYWNNIYNNRIRAGKKLTIYVPNNKVSYYKAFNTMSFDAKQKTIGKSAAATASEPTPLDPQFVYYKVRKGDNIWEIAKKFDGVSDKDIMRLNDISNSRALSLGQMLKIKRKS